MCGEEIFRRSPAILPFPAPPEREESRRKSWKRKKRRREKKKKPPRPPAPHHDCPVLQAGNRSDALLSFPDSLDSQWERLGRTGGDGATEGRGVLHPSAKNEKKNAEITLTFTLVQQEECIFSVRKQETVIKCNRDTGGPEIEGGKIFQRL